MSKKALIKKLNEEEANDFVDVDLEIELLGDF